MVLDRDLQRQILQIASKVYPLHIGNELEKLCNSIDAQKIAANLRYLEQHKLIEPHALDIAVDGTFIFGNVFITHTGMDFLADDGGLSAILGTVTIKFETEQLKAILAAKIMSSDLSSERKTTMIDAIKDLPAEGLKHLTMKIVDAGWDNLDSLMVLIQSGI